ncbi:MAG: hypothetical protein RLZZ584_835 [Pseudomonadota bacterium]
MGARPPCVWQSRCHVPVHTARNESVIQPIMKKILIVDDVLNISRIEAGKLELEQTDFLLGDPLRIALSAEQCERLFRPFEQADRSTTRRYGGSGLGLSITARLAALMGGEVGVQSQPGAGSRFWLTVRLQPGRPAPAGLRVPGADARHDERQQAQHDDGEPAPVPVSAAEVLGRLASGQRLLLAEDNLVNRELVVELLADVALRIDLACDGREAVQPGRAARYDLVLMDMQMPGLVRAAPAPAPAPVAAPAPAPRAMATDTPQNPKQPDMMPPTSPPQPPAANPPSTPAPAATGALFDPALLERITRGRSAAMRRIVGQFVSHHENDLDALARLLLVSQWRQAGLITHALQGSSAQIGAGRLHQAAAAVDRALRRGEAPLPGDVDQLTDTCARTLAYLRAWLVEQDEPALAPALMAEAVPPEVPTSVAALARLHELQALLQASDGRAIELAERLAAQPPAALGPAQRGLLVELAEGARRFEFDATLARLQAAWPDLQETLS